MKIIKTCFFEKISIIKLHTQTYLRSNHKHMGGKNTLAAATVAATLTATSPAIAESSEAKALQEAITCETKLACQKLTESIQVQIDELENKGIENLSDDEFESYSILSDDLIALEKQETEKNSDLIATENQKQEKGVNVIAAQENAKESLALLKQEQTSIRSALLEN